MTSKKARPISKKRKFVKDGIFYAELNDVLAHEFADNGYAGCDVRVTPKCTEVYIRATHTREVAGDNNKRIREITALIQKRFKYQPGKIRMFTAAVENKGLSALAQAQAVKYRLLQGLSVRLAAYSVVKLIMDRGAKGCEVIVSGKLRGQRAKAMKFRDGYMIHAGDAKNYYVEKAVKHVHLRQGVIGIKVKIMLPHDPTGVAGVKKDLPDTVKIHEPKEDFIEEIVIENNASVKSENDDNLQMQSDVNLNTNVVNQPLAENFIPPTTANVNQMPVQFSQPSQEVQQLQDLQQMPVIPNQQIQQFQ